MNKAFEEIRPYEDHEVNSAVRQLANDPIFIGIIKKIYPQPGYAEKLVEVLSEVNSIEEFQVKIIVPLLNKIEAETTNGISYSAMEQFHPEERYLFISNHRDIILDAAFLNKIMHDHGFRKTEIAIGNNLLAFDWITKLVRINRSFIVKRNLALRDQMEASKTLSAYIRHAITEKGQSVWIAQREGRSKDGFDQTQPALLKMLNMSNSQSLTEGFREMNIVPMAISYEIEPCGISKVEELLNKKHNPDFKKSQADDLKSMANGVMLPKGRVHFAFGNPVNLKIDELTAGKSKPEAVEAIVEYIDKRIYYNYKLWPNNYIAADILNKDTRYSNQYSEDEKRAFEVMMNGEISGIHFEANEAREMYLSMYANPVFNYEKYFSV